MSTETKLDLVQQNAEAKFKRWWNERGKWKTSLTEESTRTIFVEAALACCGYSIPPDRITLIRNPGGAYVCRIDDRSSGELCFDEMIGHVARIALGLPGYPMRTRAELEAQARRLSGQIDPTDTRALAEHEQYVAHRLAEDFPA